MFQKGGKKTPCSICSTGPEEFKCVQKVFVTKKKLENKYLGCGVSFSPRENIDAIPVSVGITFTLVQIFEAVLPKLQNQKKNDKEKFVVRPVIHPDELGLKPITCKPEVLKKCGLMIYEIYDIDDKDTMVSKFKLTKTLLN